MEITKVCVLVFAVLTMLTVIPAQAAEKTEITAIDVFDPFGWLTYPPDPIGDFTIGTIICTGYPNVTSLPCPTGSQTILRGWIFTARLFSGDSRIDGWETFEYNADIHADGQVNAWGKWRIDLGDSDGYWEGSYSEKGTPISEYLSIGIGKYELHGYGSVDGLLLKMEYATNQYFGGAAFTSAYTGYILDPKAK